MADFDVKKEAAWAISNATSGGTPEQIRYLVTQQCIRPLCDLLTVQDSRIINVALEVRPTTFPQSVFCTNPSRKNRADDVHVLVAGDREHSEAG